MGGTQTSALVEDETRVQTDPAAIALDELWTRVRHFLTESDEFGKKPAERRAGLKAPRIAFAESCQRSADPSNPKVVTLDALKRGFNACYLLPELTDSEIRSLVRSLEAWYQEDRQTVLYGRILDAPTHRENKSLRGIFPKMLVKSSDMPEQQSRMIKAAEDAKAAAIAEQAAKNKQKLEDDRMADAKKQSLANPTKGGNKTGQPSRDEVRRLEREEVARALADKEEGERMKKKEDAAVV